MEVGVFWDVKLEEGQAKTGIAVGRYPLGPVDFLLELSGVGRA